MSGGLWKALWMSSLLPALVAQWKTSAKALFAALGLAGLLCLSKTLILMHVSHFLPFLTVRVSSLLLFFWVVTLDPFHNRIYFISPVVLTCQHQNHLGTVVGAGGTEGRDYQGVMKMFIIDLVTVWWWVPMSKLSKLNILNRCNLLYVNYTSTKLLEKKKNQLEGVRFCISNTLWKHCSILTLDRPISFPFLHNFQIFLSWSLLKGCSAHDDLTPSTTIYLRSLQSVFCR